MMQIKMPAHHLIASNGKFKNLNRGHLKNLDILKKVIQKHSLSVAL